MGYHSLKTLVLSVDLHMLPWINVSSCFLNCWVSSICLSLFGSSFHHVGPRTLNDLGTKVFFLVNRTLRCLNFLLDLRFLLFGQCSSRSSCRYLGAFLLILLCTRVSIPYFILDLASSQCSSLRSSVVLSYLDLLKMILRLCFVFLRISLW